MTALQTWGARARAAVDPSMLDSRFELTQEPEPHRDRRRRILSTHPEVAALFGFDRRTIAVTLGVLIAQLGVAWWLSRVDAGWWATAAIAYVFGAIASHWLGQTIHETAHRLAARSAWANRALAWLANAPMVLPMAATFHRYHLEHHIHLGTIGKDSDLPLPLEIDVIGASRWRKFLWLLFYPIVYFIRGARSARGVSWGEFLNFAFLVVVNIAVWHFWGPKALGYLALSTFFGHGLHPVAAHFIHEHYLFAAGQETTSYYGPLNWVTFNVGYHVEHHDFMNIPGWRLPQYRTLVAAEYSGLVSHRSWAWVLFEFIWRRELGPASRVVREASRAHRSPLKI